MSEEAGANIADKWADEIVPLLNEMKSSSSTTLNVTLFKLNTILEIDNEKLDSKQRDSILFVILSTYKRYPYDSKFNNQVLKSFKLFIDIDAEKYSKNILAFIAKQSANSIAIRDLLTLVNWNCALINLKTDTEYFTTLLKVSTSNLISLVSLISEYSDLENIKKHKLRAVSADENEIVKSFKLILKSNPDNLSTLIETICNDKLSVSGIISVLGLLSVAINETHDKKVSELFISKEKDICNFIVKYIFATKNNPTAYSLQLFAKYINTISMVDSFDIILSGLEKTALRNSELTFASLAPTIFSALDYNLISVISSLSEAKFQTQLFSSLKASKESVRVGASETLSTVLKNNKSDNVNTQIEKIIDESFKVLKTLASSAIDQKLLVLNILDSVNLNEIESSKKIMENIAPFINKENNEIVSAKLTDILLTRFTYFISKKIEFDTKSKIIDMINTGLKDKKITNRIVWTTRFSNAVLISSFSSDNENDVIDLFNTGITDSLLKTFDDCVIAPLPSINNKLISAGYASIAILFNICETFNNEDLRNKLLDFDVVSKALADTETKLSCFTNSKIITKLTNDETAQKWYIRSLYSLSRYFDEPSSLFGFACLYTLISRNFTPSARLLAKKLISECVVLKQKVIGFSLTNAINDLTEEFEYNPEFNYDFNYMLPAISTTIHKFEGMDKELLESQLCELLIPYEHKILSNHNNGWVSLCQRCGADPGKIVSNNGKLIVEKISNILADPSDDVFQNGLFDAACKTTSIISFFSPASIVPLFTDIINKDLSIVPSLDIDDTKFEIWKGNDGELVIDVLESKKDTYIGKSKDSATLKWEASVREELKAKNKLVKKHTKEEIIKINEQLELEKTIRHSINLQYLKLRRSLEIIIYLSKQAASVDNATKIWFPVAISNILILLNSATAVKLTGALAADCFLTLSDVVATNTLTGSSSMKFVGASTLRLHSVEHIPEEFTGKPLDELLSSQLFSLKLCSDKSLFNSLTLMYVLPLLVTVIENGKKYAMKNNKKVYKANAEFIEESPEEEQLSLALEIVSTNSELFEDSSIPRTTLLENLLALLAIPSKAKPAKECFISLCQNISLNVSDHDLSIILKSLTSSNVFVRFTILEALDQEFDLSELNFNEELWISCFDNTETNKEVAETIWSESEFTLDENVPFKLIPYLGNKDNGIRVSIAKALATSILKLHSHQLFVNILDQLIELYKVMAKPPEPETDEFGLIIQSSLDSVDRWEQRSGVALTIMYLAPMFTESEDVSKIFNFLISERSLGDVERIVRSELQEAGLKIIDATGKSNVEVLINVFETFLNEKDEKSRVQDMVKESVIILYGTLARNLDPSDERIDSIIDKLLKSLDIPSEDVQYAVSECISPLVPFIDKKLPKYIDDLFEKLFTGKSLARRRGAAYGIAGLAKGVGIKALCDFDIIRNLTEASDDKKDNIKRESVLFAFECISQSFGPLFEPYVVEILPIVLRSFGDQSSEVREATNYAARVIMKNTTSYGIKKMIPLAIDNLEDYAWRTKKGSVELLGSMAYLDPAQLSSSLPDIVPELVGVLNDTHKEVRKAADDALKKFGEVIRNPEIQELVPTLLKAIGDPTKYTNEALDELIKTQFVHYIDGPSLALIIHVIDRGMQDRSANTKKKACQIVGNMAILVDAHDLMPYLSKLVNELNDAVVDPVPQTRATAARALGSLIEKLGEDKFPGLISNLLDALQDEEKPGNRLGSAQGLAEIISGLGISKLEEMLPIIIQGTKSTKAFVREGYMPLLLFLPVCFGTQFAPYLSMTIPSILSGLADTEEVRDVSLRTGRLIVNNYAKKAVDLLLPELEKGLSDYNARIRLSSVELTGELLFKISGISGKLELADDFNLSKNVTKAFNEVLGIEKRNQILSALFVCRSDVSGAVRATAANIWKALVANTPKTIKEIMPTLTNIIVRRLASPDETQRNIVAATLGDMIKRVGGNALEQLLPTLQESMVNSDSDAKQGICIAIYELTRSTSSDNVIAYQEIFVNIVKEALVDPNPSVREAAAQAFDSLQESIGSTVVDEVIPQLLEMLNSSDGSDDALSALQEIMSTKSDVIFPILIPSLLTPPINGRAIGALAQAAGSALYKRLSTIINALVNGIANDLGDETELYAALTKTLTSVDSDDGCHPLLQQILSLMKHEDINKRKIIFDVLPEFFKETPLDYSVYTEDLVIQCIYLLNDADHEVATKSFETLTILIKKQSKEMLEKLVYPAQQTLSYIQNSSKEIFAFTLPRGPNCVLPIFLHGLMYGNPQQRETSANGISIVIDNTPEIGLKPFVTVIVGPLIRVIGERFSGNVKSAILLAINKLFSKIPKFLFPFIPQLQRTFIKCLSDPTNELLRTRAAKALGTLIKYQPKVDPLVTELLNNAKAISSDNIALKTAILKALLEVVDKAGSKMSESSKNGIMVLVEEDMFNEEAGVGAAVAYAKLVGALSKILEKSELNNMLKSKIFSADLNDEDSSRFAILTLNAFLKDSAESVLNCGLFNEICDFIISASSSPKPYVSDNSTIAIGKLLLSLDKLDSENEEFESKSINELIKQLCINMNNPASNSPDTRRLSLVVARTITRYQYDRTVLPYLNFLIPSVFSCVRDPILPIKLSGEKAMLSILKLVEDQDNTIFNNWVESLNGVSTIETVSGSTLQIRSITEYVKRVGVRLANVERERISAGGDKEAMFSDQYEDESEIWAIGGVDLSEE